MPYINRVKKKGNYYLYLVKDARINGKKVHIYQKYIGPENRIKELEISNLLTKHVSDVECETIEFGISAALWQIAKEIDLIGIIDDIVGKSRQQGLTLGEYILIATINRCVTPCSKSKIAQWFERDWLSTNFDIDPKTLNASTYWNHFQLLDTKIIEDIGIALGKKIIKEKELNLKSLLYDPTNFFTFSRGKHRNKESELLQFGHSKESRNGNRIVAFWLVCDRDSGIPLFHKVYPGNQQDAKTFKDAPKQITRQLNAIGSDPKNITLVFDNGNLSKDAMDIIESEKIKFIASRRPSTHEDLLHKPLDQFTDTIIPITNKSVKYFRTKNDIYGVERIVYVIFDPAKHKKNVAEFSIKLDEKIRKISEFFSERLNPKELEIAKGPGKKWLKKIEVEKKVKKMIGKAPFRKVIITNIIGPEEVNIGEDEDEDEDEGKGKGKEGLSLNITIDKAERALYEETLGRQIIFTNRDDWSAEKVIWGYREQYIVEHAFMHLKCPTCIAIRPMYHYADPCIKAHIFICVLAYQLLALLRLKLSQKGIFLTYSELLNSLSGIKITKIIAGVNTENLFKLNRTKGISQKIIKILNLKQYITI